MRYKVGDRVVVRSDIIENETYYNDNGVESNSVTDTMAEMAGLVVTIKEIHCGQYTVEEDEFGWHWVDGMFEDSELSEDQYDDVDMLGFMEVFNEI